MASEAQEQRVKRTIACAKQLLDEMEPVVPTAMDLAEKVRIPMGISRQTARKYLTKGCESGELLELKPRRNFEVTQSIPAARQTYVGSIRVVREYVNARPIELLSTDENKRPRSSWGPGNTTYMITADYGSRYVEVMAMEKKAKEEQKAADYEAQKKLERAEIRRRHPGLLNLTRRLSLILGFADGYDGRSSARLHEPIASRTREKQPLEEWDLHVDVDASNDMVPVLREILTAGLDAYLISQPSVQCRHCGERILHFERQGGWWWHLKSTRAKCKDADTVAAPPEST